MFFCCSSLRSVKIEVGSTAVEVVRNGPGVSIMVPIKKNALKSLKISSDTGQIDESTFFFNLRIKLFETNCEIFVSIVSPKQIIGRAL